MVNRFLVCNKISCGWSVRKGEHVSLLLTHRCALCFGVLDKDGKCNTAPLFKYKPFTSLDELVCGKTFDDNDAPKKMKRVRFK